MNYQSKDKTTSDSSDNYLNKETTSTCDSSADFNSFCVQSLEEYALLNSSNEENRNIYLIIDSKGKRKLSQELSISNSSKNLSSIKNLANNDKNSVIKKKISPNINKFVVNTNLNKAADKNVNTFSNIVHKQQLFQQKKINSNKYPKAKKYQSKAETPIKFRHQWKTIMKLFLNFLNNSIFMNIQNNNEANLKLAFMFIFLYVIYFLVIKFISIGSYPIVVFSFY